MSFGRRVEFDERSRSFPARALLSPAQAATPRSFTWRNPIRLNQGVEGSCVGHAWAHEAAAKPVPVPGMTHAVALDIYRRAQALDGFPETPPEEGTSIIAGAKAMQERKLLATYRWAFGIADLILAVGWHGPAVLGIPWYEGMMKVDRRGFARVAGGVVGGHAILCNRVNVTDRFFGLSNSWGPSCGTRDAWSLGGTCRVSFADMERLLGEDGEACVPVRRVP